MEDKATVMIDGLRIALEMERRGQSLYARAQQIVENPKLLALLRQLELEEIGHHETFTAMLTQSGAPVLSGEENALVAAKVADFFFPGSLMQVAMDGGLSTTVSLLKEAIQAEKNSIKFYTKLKEFAGEESVEMINSIISEEEKHLETLQERMLEVEKEGPSA